MSCLTRHLLVPTNFGVASQIAKWTAMNWALSSAAKITLIHVSRSDDQVTGLNAFRCLHQPKHVIPSVGDRLQKLAEMTRTPHPEIDNQVAMQAVLRQGDVIREIEQFVSSNSVDTVVIGAAHWRLPWQSSLGTRLARRLSCQVVVVHEPARQFAAFFKANGRRIKSHMVGIDELADSREPN